MLRANKTIVRARDQIRANLKRIEPLRRLRDDLDLLRKYRRWRPEKAPIYGTQNALFANPREARGRALLRTQCRGQRELKSLWMRAVEQIRPNVVVDVGVNYGEFLFMPVYDANSRLYGVEADPNLTPYLHRSLTLHPNKNQIELVQAAASNASGGSVSFFQDVAWSGRSSVELRPSNKNAREVSVPRITVDELVGTIDRSTRFLFKVDVESHEPEVFAGMTKTLANCAQWVGIVEFDAETLTSIGKRPAEFLASLRCAGHVWSLQAGHSPKPIRCVADLAEPAQHADLVILSDLNLAAKLGLSSQPN